MTRARGYNALLREYLDELKRREVGKEHVRRSELVLKKLYRWLKEDNRKTYPTLLNYEDVIFFRDKIPLSEKPNQSSRNQKNIIETFRAFLRFCGNYVRQPPFKPYHPYRPRINARDYDTLMLEMEGKDDWDFITGRIMILLGSLGIRRIGQLRLRPEDIQEDRMNVMGKGRYGGKPRVLPIDPWTYSTLREYMDLRREIIKDCLIKRPNQKIPEKLLIWHTYQNKIGSVHKTKYNRIMRKISESTGIKVTAHSLRRYGGTEIYRITKDVETSMMFGGWSDARTFREYLGLDPDLAEAVEKMMQIRLERIKKNYKIVPESILIKQ